MDGKKQKKKGEPVVVVVGTDLVWLFCLFVWTTNVKSKGGRQQIESIPKGLLSLFSFI